MVGKSSEAASLRRRRIEALELRGASPAAIATAVGSDLRTVRRDLHAIAQQRGRSANLSTERHRLLDSAKLVEQQAWELFESLPPADANGRLGALGKVLASQAHVVKLVGDLVALDVVARVDALEQALADSTGARR
jgi:hypothetical protein